MKATFVVVVVEWHRKRVGVANSGRVSFGRAGPGQAGRRSGRLGTVQGICVMAGEVAGSSPRSLWLLRV